MRLPFQISEAFEWINKDEGIFRRDPTPENPTGLFRRVDCPRCGGNGEDDLGACYKCGMTGIIDIPQIEGIGNRTLDAFDPEEDEGRFSYSSHDEYGGDVDRYADMDYYEDEPLDASQPRPSAPPETKPADPDDEIPF